MSDLTRYEFLGDGFGVFKRECHEPSCNGVKYVLYADHEAEVQRLSTQVRLLRDALEKANIFAIHGCGTRQKDARGKQFAAIADLTRAALDDPAGYL